MDSVVLTKEPRSTTERLRKPNGTLNVPMGPHGTELWP